MLIALDLFCCAGGASQGLTECGFDVFGVDIEPRPTWQRRFGASRFRNAAVLDDLLVGGDFVPMPRFIWASPPCQRYSDATRQTGTPDNHPDLIEPVRVRLQRLAREHGIAWCIENVPRAPLVDPIMLCGAMFDLGVVRHRIFETSWPIAQPSHVKHKGSLVTGEYVTVAGNGGVPAWTLKEREKRGLPRHREGEFSLANWSRAMGIDWMMRAELVEAIPPAYSRWIGERL